MKTFGKEFYPSTEDLAEEIAKDVIFWAMNSDQCDWHKSIKVLDPSAGSGVLLDAVKKMGGNSDYVLECLGKEWSTDNRWCPTLKVHAYAIEPVPELQSVLYDKKVKVVAHDFLKYETQRSYDAIVMNPPFSNGDEHLLKAWEICKGGLIVCILNAETLKNPFSRRRQQLANLINDNGGKVEYRQNAFVNADRPTGVEIAIVRLEKEVEVCNDFNFEGTRLNLKSDFTQEDLENQVARRDLIDNWLVALENAEAELREVMKAHTRWNHYLGVLAKKVRVDDDRMPHLARHAFTMKGDREIFSEMIDEMHALAWDNLFATSKVSEMMTEGVRNEFRKQAEAYGELAFSRENIEHVIEMLLFSRGNIMNKCIEESFEYLTKYYDGNRVHIEGWRTNDAYKVNKKAVLGAVIDTWMAKFNEYSVRWEDRRRLDDLEKSLTFLDGYKFPDKDDEEGVRKLTKILESKVKSGEFGKWHDSKYFRFKFYKKGTLHLEFKDKQLWEMFNEKAADGKQWLPEESRDSRHKWSESVA